MAIIFDGKTYALKKKELLRAGATLLREKGIIPHMATIIVGSEPASSLYVNLKKKFIEEIGCQSDIYNLTENTKLEDIKLLIKTLNEDESVHGIMIQFPLPSSLQNSKFEILNSISSNKDVDGLLENSDYIHPTAKAVLEIIKIAEIETKIEIKNIDVVGASGMVGKPLVYKLRKFGYQVTEYNKSIPFKGVTFKGQVVASATGVMNLITPNMVKKDSVLIDVGSPVGDISPLCEEKASFLTPVPGGVGPVTITCLAENLLIAASYKVGPLKSNL